MLIAPLAKAACQTTFIELDDGSSDALFVIKYLECKPGVAQDDAREFA